MVSLQCDLEAWRGTHQKEAMEKWLLLFFLNLVVSFFEGDHHESDGVVIAMSVLQLQGS